MKEGIWFIEKHTDDLIFHYRVERIIYHGRTKFQKVDIVDLEVLGKTLFLDNKIQSAQIDEHIYHEMLVHPAMFTHPSPERVLILGGGEGATLREVLKHSSVKEAIMVDIDEELVNVCRQHMKEWHDGAFDNPRSRLIFTDAREFVENNFEPYDIIISDLTEPIEEGPSIKLFTKEFYTTIFNRLKEDGIFVAQAGSADPVYPDFLASLYRTLKAVFPIVHVYWTFVFSFQLPWAFIIASKKLNPEAIDEEKVLQRMKEIGLSRFSYYYPRMHTASFVIPTYVKEALETKGDIIKDDAPFIWKA